MRGLRVIHMAVLFQTAGSGFQIWTSFALKKYSLQILKYYSRDLNSLFLESGHNSKFLLLKLQITCSQELEAVPPPVLSRLLVKITLPSPAVRAPTCRGEVVATRASVFSVVAPNLWNGLPHEACRSHTLLCFRYQAPVFLFMQAFNWNVPSCLAAFRVHFLAQRPF